MTEADITARKREQDRERMRRLRCDPAFQERERERKRDPEYMERQREYQRERYYGHDPAARLAVLQKRIRRTALKRRQRAAARPPRPPFDIAQIVREELSRG